MQNRDPFSSVAAHAWMAHVMGLATSFYERQLWSSPHAAQARALLRSRRISDQTAKLFRLGFAPPGWERLQRYMAVQGVPLPALEQLGLVIARRRGSGYFDKFRARLIFPTTDAQRVISLAGRAIMPADQGPKYNRTKSTDLSRATPALFALDHASPQLARTGRALLVEGFFDAMSLHQAGLTATAALSGTSLSSEQIDRLARAGARSMTLLFDGDAGGRASAQRLAAHLYRAPLPCRLACCPDGQDPDQVVHALGAGGVAALFEAAREPADLMIDAVSVSAHASIEAKARVLQELLAALAQTSRRPSSMQVDRISLLFGISAATVRHELL